MANVSAAWAIGNGVAGVWALVFVSRLRRHSHLSICLGRCDWALAIALPETTKARGPTPVSVWTPPPPLFDGLTNQ